MGKNSHTLVNRQNGELAFKIFSFEDASYFDHIQRQNYYSIILIFHGDVELQVDFTTYSLPHKSILCLSPYQPYLLKSDAELSGITLNFHPDFFCTYKHQNEVESEGVLFNNIYEPPFFPIGDEQPLVDKLNQMKEEIESAGLAQHELLVSLLKIFLITVLRIKVSQTPRIREQLCENSGPLILQKLTDSIEQNYKNKHSASDYAGLLNISPNALAKLVKNYFHKTLTDLIAQRIMIEAKRELYLTPKSVKEISHLLGYNDEYYFSRFFKNQAGISPQIYRNTVGFAKQEK
ncbi:MAG: helix-turn-helix domain-containing protein [Cyclobacteriaceae bacterium]